MKKKWLVWKMLAMALTFSVTVLAAVTIIAGCRVEDKEDGSDKDKKDSKPPIVLMLSSLDLRYEGTDDNLVAGFSREIKGYEVKLEKLKERKGGKLAVSAAADDAAAAIVIKINGLAVETSGEENGGRKIFSAKTDVPEVGGEAFDIAFFTAKDAAGTTGETPDYTITVTPEQSHSQDSYELSALEIRYEDGEINLINFNKAAFDYSLNAGKHETKIKVKALAASTESGVEFVLVETVDGTSIGTSIGTGKGSLETDVPLPAKGGASKKLAIRVTEGGGAKSTTYNITLYPYAEKMITWTGSVVNKLGAGGTSDGKTIASVTARDAGLTVKSAALTTQIENGFAWRFEAVETYSPESFLVTLKDEEEKVWACEALFPAVVKGSPVVLELKNAGKRLGNAEEFYDYLNDPSGTNDTSFSLTGDIDLEDYPGNWAGPDGYKGHFLGNGYTIKLALSQTTGYVGLFKSLGSGAVVEDFTVEVSTKDPNAGIQAIHFGGVIGHIEAAATIKNVTVKGTLEFGTLTGMYVIVGGIIGGVYAGNNTDAIVIENCVSELDIILTNGASTTGNTSAFGGIVGAMQPGTVTISNCYSTGNITVRNDGDQLFSAGGIVGDVKERCTLLIENCYASGDIVAGSNRETWTKTFNAGGLIGVIGGDTESFDRTPIAVTVTNCAALNKKVLTLTTSDSDKVHSGRILGWNDSRSAFPLTTTNNIALKGMRLGKVDPSPANNETGAANDPVLGLGVTKDQLKDPSYWIDTLHWDDSVWDFSGVSKGDWPVLRK